MNGQESHMNDGVSATHVFPCVPCPQGTYKEQIKVFPCYTCPEGTTTSGTGHTSVDDCGKLGTSFRYSDICVVSEALLNVASDAHGIDLLIVVVSGVWTHIC